MKKSILSIYFILLIIGCKNQEPQKTTPQKPLEVESLIGEEGETVILGYMNRANLNTPEFQAWFQPEYDNIKIPEGWAEEFKLALFLKAENKVPSSKFSISPPTGSPCANLVTLVLVFFNLS